MDYVDKFMTSLIVAAVTLPTILLSGSPSNKEWVEARAPAFLAESGYTIVNKQGFKWAKFGYGTAYGGAAVWYEVRRVPDNGISYQLNLRRWGEQVEIWELTALDAIKPSAR